jgi:hypothetical protein
VPVRIGTIFALTAIAMAIQAWRIGGFGYLLVWPASAFGVLAAAYLGGGPGVFGKRADGTIAPVRRLLTLPATSFMQACWWIENRLRRRDAFNEVVPGLFIGRRPTHLPDGVDVVIDLAGEFAAHPVARAVPGYLSVPVLDRWVTSDPRFVDLIGSMATNKQVAFVHCAQGHGRSAQVVAGVLIARGLATSAEQAMKLVKQHRPGARLAPIQLEQLRRCLPALRPRPANDAVPDVPTV